MADVSWPLQDKKPSAMSEKTIATNRIKTDFDSGHVLTRKRFTRNRKKFNLVWDESGYHPLTDEEKETLETFFNNHCASSIEWLHPWTNNSYTVVFSDDELEFEMIHPKRDPSVGYWKVTVNLEEP